jgi:hypothetical protein
MILPEHSTPFYHPPQNKNPIFFFKKWGLIGLLNEPAFLVRALKKIPFCPISASDSNFNPRNTICIPVVKIFVFLDLEQN